MRWLLAFSILNHSAFSGSRVAVALAGLELNASPFAIGLILSFYSLLPMFLAVAGGRWVDRVGLRIPMLTGTALLAFGIVVPFMAWDIGSLYLSSVTVGVGFMAFHICTQKAAGDLGGAQKRKDNFSLLAIGYSISGFLGPTLAGVSIDTIGHRVSFGLLAAMALLCGLLLWRYPTAALSTIEPAKSEPAKSEPAATTGKVTELFQNPDLRRLFLAIVLISSCWDVHQFLVPLYGAQQGLSASSIGLVLGTYAAATLVIRLALPLLSRRFSEWRMILAAMWTAFVVYALYPWFPTLPMMLALSFALGLGLGVCQPMILSALHRSAPEGRIGEAVGLRMTLVSATQTFLPAGFGAMGSVLGLAPMFIGMSLLVGGGAIFARRGLSRDDMTHGGDLGSTKPIDPAQVSEEKL